jgi:hypothetical protein
MCGTIAPKQQETGNMGNKLDRRMVLTHIPGALPMPCYLCETSEEQMSVRHSVFKTKYIMQPTMKPADTITKALNNLMQALKGKSNAKGLEQIKALKNWTPSSTTHRK